MNPRVALLLITLLLTALSAVAQRTAALTGQVLDSSGASVPAATVTLRNALTAYRAEVLSDSDGRFAFANIPFQDYTLTVERAGFDPANQSVSLRTNVGTELTVMLVPARAGERVSVSATETVQLVDAESTGTRTAMSLANFEKMPIPVGTRGVEQVLLSFPGFAPNANGAIHPRGAHNQMTFMIDGLPISDQLTGSFAGGVDASLVQTIELMTGNIPAEFGSKVSGVASITTRSGLGTGRKFLGATEFSAATQDTLANTTQVGGEKGRFGYFSSVSLLETHRFLDAVSLDNLHNGGNSQRGFIRLDYQASDRDQLRFHAMSGRSSFELANLRSQQESGQRQRQLLRDAAFWGAWVRTLSPSATIDVVTGYRTSIAQLFGSAGDTPLTADQARHLSNFTTGIHASVVRGGHTLRAGYDTQFFPVSENFTFGITDPRFNDPANEDYRPTLLPFDLTRGGRRFVYSGKQTGSLHSGWVHDNWRLGNWTLSLGLRYDIYDFLVRGNQLQPRLGVAYRVPRLGTVLRASYNRNYQTPPNENLLLSNSLEARALAPAAVREALNGAYIPIRPERQNVFEVGFQQPLLKRFSVDGTYYHKYSFDQQDNDNFLNTGVILPLTLSKIRVNGAEGRINVPEFRGFSGTVSFTHARAISTPPFSGGLFLNEGAIELLTAGPFVIDHDQRLGIQSTAIYRNKRRWWTSTTVRYDSGLVANPSDPAEVAQDPDYADLLPYVNLTSGLPARVNPRTIIDAAVGYERYRGDKRFWDLTFQVSNLTNRTALYNFQSVFVGTRVVPPRIVGAKFRIHW